MSESCMKNILQGPRYVIEKGSTGYPAALERIADPPRQLYVVGNLEALEEGLAVVGARKATPYGISCAKRFAVQAARKGITIVSGGARGCDAAAHEAALEARGKTVVVLGGGCDRLYPAEHKDLFQRVIDAGGAVVSEQFWQTPPLPWMFRLRNRLIAGLGKGTLIVEAGLPSGTFSTADEALSAGREVLVVPGSIHSEYSHGANRLIQQGATPIIDDESFNDALFQLFGCLKEQCMIASANRNDGKVDPVVAAAMAQPMGVEELYMLAQKHHGQNCSYAWLMECLMSAVGRSQVARYPDGRYGPC